MQVFNNSSLVINRIKEFGYLHNIHLRLMGDLLWEVVVSFEHINFTHVYRNLNQDAGKVSKEGRHLDASLMSFEEVDEGVFVINSSSL